MANLEVTELKLKSTATGGVDASHSPYWRRLLSAGYKGFLQGSIGGAGLYGAFGLVIGGLVYVAALPLVPAAAAGAAIALIPAAGLLGVVKGATTFGNIGSVAAINAESADLSEQRRYLLDRYYDLPPGPEGDREAAAIRQELLARQNDVQTPPSFFHWKTLIIGALLGALFALSGAALLHFGIISEGAVSGLLGAKLGTAIAGLSAATLTMIGTIAGVLAGASIGVDRYYIRKWFDHTEGVVHSSSHKDYGLMERHKQVERIKEAAKEDEKTKAQLATAELDHADKAPVITNAEKPASPVAGPVASLDKPANRVSANTISADRLKGLAEIHKAMELTPL